MSAVQQVVYIAGGAALLNCLAGVHHLLVSINEKQPISRSYFYVALFSPLVTWQFIVGVCTHLESEIVKDINPFVLSFLTLMPLICIVALSLTLFPIRKKIGKFNNQEKQFKLHLKDNRRVFFFTVFSLVVSLTLFGICTGVPTTKAIVWLRIMICIVSALAFLVSIKLVAKLTNGDEIQVAIMARKPTKRLRTMISTKMYDNGFSVYSLRIPWFKKESIDSGTVFYKDEYRLLHYKVPYSSLEDAINHRKKIYNTIDRYVIVIMLVCFSLITLLRALPEISF